MTKLEAAKVLRGRHVELSTLREGVRRKRSWSPSEKAITHAHYKEQMRALEIGYHALTNEYMFRPGTVFSMLEVEDATSNNQTND